MQTQATHKRMFLQSDRMLQRDLEDFRQVGSDHFTIADQNEITELSGIIKTNFKNKSRTFGVQPIQAVAEAQQFQPAFENYKNKSNSLMDALDSQKKKLDTEKSNEFIENKCLYYCLDDVEYNDKDTLSEAFAFLKSLEKNIHKQINEKQTTKDAQNQDNSEGSSNQISCDAMKQVNEEKSIEIEDLEDEFDILTFKPSYKSSSKRTNNLHHQLKKQIPIEEEIVRQKIQKLVIQDDYQIEQ